MWNVYAFVGKVLFDILCLIAISRQRVQRLINYLIYVYGFDEFRGVVFWENDHRVPVDEAAVCEGYTTVCVEERKYSQIHLRSWRATDGDGRMTESE